MSENFPTQAGFQEKMFDGRFSREEEKKFE